MPVQTLDYRTDDLTRWGLGYGGDLPAGVIDLDFWKLFTAIEDLENAQHSTVSIDYMNLVGDQLYIHLTDHSVQGPFTVPHTVWNPRGPFLGGVTYQPLDVIDNGNGALYVVNVAHVSVAPFDANRSDGQGHDLYTLLLSQPQNSLPTGGLLGQRLVKSSGSPFVTAWAYDRIRMNLLISGQPDPGELLLQHLIDEPMILPAGLENSLAFAAIPPAASAQFQLARDGAPIGSITFAPSPHVVVSFPAEVDFVAGNVLTLTAPAAQDANLANISFNLVAYLASAE